MFYRLLMNPKIDDAFDNNFIAELTQLKEKEGVNSLSKLSFGYVIMSAKQNEYPDELKNKIIELIKENQANDPNDTITKIKTVVNTYHDDFKKQNEIKQIKKYAANIIGMKYKYNELLNKLKLSNQFIDNSRKIFNFAASITQTPNDKIDNLHYLLHQLRTYELLNENIYDIKILIEEGCNQLQELLRKGDHQEDVSKYENILKDFKLKVATLSSVELFLEADNLDILKKQIEGLDWIKKILEEQEKHATEIKKHVKEELKEITPLQKVIKGGIETLLPGEKMVPGEIVGEEFINKINKYKKTLEKISELDSAKKIVDYYESEVKTIENDFKNDFQQNIDKFKSEFKELQKNT